MNPITNLDHLAERAFRAAVAKGADRTGASTVARTVPRSGAIPPALGAANRSPLLSAAAGAVAGLVRVPTIPARNTAQRGATPCDVAQHKTRPCETNPPTPADAETLDPRRLAAARLIAGGRSTAQAAATLGVSRGTVWRWQLRPAFKDELKRLHMVLTATLRPPPPRGR